MLPHAFVWTNLQVELDQLASLVLDINFKNTLFRFPSELQLCFLSPFVPQRNDVSLYGSQCFVVQSIES